MNDAIKPSGPISAPAPKSTAIAPAGSISAPGEKLAEPPVSTGADMLGSFGAGVARGAAQLAGLPGTVSDLVDTGLTAAGKKIGIIPEDWKAPNKSMLSGDVIQGAASTLTGGATDYRGQTRAGRVAGTVGEFVPGALAAPGSLGTRLLTGAVAPGTASEIAGQMAEKSSSPWAEPAARVAGAILGGVAGNKIENMVRGAISPTGGADEAMLDTARRLREQGIPVTAGQATGNKTVLNAEADTAMGQMIAGATPDSAQAQAFTTATMRHLGSSAPLATPEAMLAAKNGIISRMTSALDGVDVVPNMPMALKVADAADFYRLNTPAAERIPIIRNIMSQINDAASTGAPISGAQLASWRSNLGEYLSHPNNGVSGTAHRLREAIDEAVENSMRAMGQPERIDQWRASLNQYRNYIAVRDALKVTRESGIANIVTPKDLMNALAKQSKDEIVTGRRGDIADLASSGMSMLRPLSKEGKHGLVDTVVRKAGPLATAAGAGFGALQGAQFLGLGPLMTAATTGAAVARPVYQAAKDAILSQAMRPSVQRYLENQMVNSTSGISGGSAAVRGLAAGLPSVGVDRVERKSGGRVGVNHDALAEQLARAAEHAKKELGRSTEPLLSQSDEAVAHALEVANRSI
jgi:hypothetical protein